MKKTKILLVVSTLMFAFCVAVVQAPPRWDSIQAGYAVTTSRFGEDIIVNVDEVIAMAGTTDPAVESVLFRWFPPGEDEEPAWNETVSTSTMDSWKGIDFRRFDSSEFIPDMVGHWGVQAFFIGPGGQLRNTTDIIAIRATTGMVVPEVEFGTVAIVLSMFVALGAYTLRKRLF